MPVTPFRTLFFSLGDNETMSLKMLRLKVVASLALVCMLRPSDIAPRSVPFDKQSGSIQPRIFSTDHVKFNHDTGAVSLMFTGIKNDTSRSGFQVTIPATDNSMLDHISALSVYVHRTKMFPNNIRGHPVFLPLQTPYHALSADTIRYILDTAIDMAGLAGQGFSAKCFRPTGTTYAIALGYDPEIVMRIERWKMRSVFF